MTTAFAKTATILALMGAAPAALATEIGTVALAQSGVTGTPPAAPDRALQTGTRVVLDERVRTAGRARAEFLFLDQTTLSMGPDTEIVLDRFVYDPASGSGEFALSLTKGALRFIGGAASDGAPAIVTTPTATIGIRGSSAIIQTDGTETRAVFVAGDQMCVSTQGGSVCTSEFGGVLTEDGYQGRVGPEELATLVDAVEGDMPPPAPGAGVPQTDLGDVDLSSLVPPDAPPVSTRGTPLVTLEQVSPQMDTPATVPAVIDAEDVPPPCVPREARVPCR